MKDWVFFPLLTEVACLGIEMLSVIDVKKHLLEEI